MNKLTIQAVTSKIITICGSIDQAEKLVIKARESGDKNSVIQVYATKGESCP